MKNPVLMIAVIAAAVMELIDTSIVNVALSQMSGNLGATLEDTSWVITAYAIANVIIIPITSFLVAKLGRRNYYIGSIIMFSVFSLLCGQATNIWTLVACRFFQGIGGGALLSVSQAIVFELFPREKQNIASALFGIGVFVGPTIGPTLGGFITENFEWPWIFYINVPIGLVVTLVCLSRLGEPAIKPVAGRIDWTGIFLLAVGVGSLQTVLERGETDDWFNAGYIVCLTAAAVLGLTLFIWWELRVKHPVVNLHVLRSKNLSIAAALTFVSGMGIFSSVYLTPVLAQRILGFTPTQTGLLLLPGAILAIGGLIVSARLLQRGVSPVVMVATGMLLFVLFSYRMSVLNLGAGATDMSVPLIFRGVGLAIVTVPLTTLAVSTLEPKDFAQGAALNNMMRQLGGSFGIALVNTFLARKFAQHRSILLEKVTAYDPAYNERLRQYTGYFQAKGSDAQEAGARALGVLNFSVDQQSLLMSYLDGFLLLGIVFMAALPLLLLTRARRRGTPAVVLSDH
ncbi:DHA2 family efflux MFS transporter permease subunit [Dinghuibacter silviterrae]|uniref:DHA2 family multidrug resistance protein n=1 Tax=Dinghuibacter silviterrae TaxID=1539049 RepID=A0A4R8DEZ8_9BACT|nr:DHA2 family efflux MFS transporter permease subunit [Dinghuibacter silviterrae]TDW96149.1 DHA2 family multidrug resistance protein [Dinghuibacter silviterrae]